MILSQHAAILGTGDYETVEARITYVDTHTLTARYGSKKRTLHITEDIKKDIQDVWPCKRRLVICDNEVRRCEVISSDAQTS